MQNNQRKFIWASMKYTLYINYNLLVRVYTFQRKTLHIEHHTIIGRASNQSTAVSTAYNFIQGACAITPYFYRVSSIHYLHIAFV